MLDKVQRRRLTPQALAHGLAFALVSGPACILVPNPEFQDSSVGEEPHLAGPVTGTSLPSTTGLGTGADGDASGSATEATADTSTQACGVVTLSEGLVAYFTFDEEQGLVANDASGNGNHGTLVAMGESARVPGRFGRALDFNGTGSNVDANASTSIDDLWRLGGFTACAWILPRSYPEELAIIADKSEDKAGGGWNFYIRSNGTLGLFTNPKQWANGGSIELGSWQYVCGAWDGIGDISLYIDGTSTNFSTHVTNSNGSDSDGGRHLLVGRANDGTSPFDGLIDEFRLYDRVLTEAEVASLAQCSSD